MFAIERNSGWRPFSGIGVDLCGLPAERRQTTSDKMKKRNLKKSTFSVSEGKEEATTQEQSMNIGHPIQLFIYQIQYFISMTTSHEPFSSSSSEISFD
ncbi:uncharacterized protein MONOS_9951 [Monocercomonoides exilis]|uniref:uncharacterized protein n=1 Tax=Monocercomonoides exilis TaxID=2049356 RepID=UPI00355AAD00|nr:hypothetical protein MONOS_9951 [Monocercomonoides exilis]|eukprot:MONOS_9951.1-p1 / transcript=MONOS_9951.1 / gene=MONOS_9951 / organism=Monocercomonoides_exilis_PA203 / gene_product=unspecified product / transcript_product=unspecified product / location=Mono_scaffold00430:37310-38082(-) / protein_length=98 / sequence_SO=supercontig / SO=protein_coding / is_pseudo=false